MEASTRNEGTARPIANQALQQLLTESLNAYLQPHGWQITRHLWWGYSVWWIEQRVVTRPVEAKEGHQVQLGQGSDEQSSICAGDG